MIEEEYRAASRGYYVLGTDVRSPFVDIRVSARRISYSRVKCRRGQRIFSIAGMKYALDFRWSDYYLAF